MAKKKTTGLAGTLNSGLGKKVDLKKKNINVSNIEKVSEKLHDEVPKKVPIQKMTIEVPKDLHIQIKIKAAQEGMKMKDYIISLVRNDLGV